MPEINTPHPTDTYVGNRIRVRRRALGVSQEKLAADLGLTFQQVQKYERGANRVSASKLHDIGKSLDVPVGFFFEGLEQPESVEAQGAEFFGIEGSFELAENFRSLPTPKRKIVGDLARSLREG